MFIFLQILATQGFHKLFELAESLVDLDSKLTFWQFFIGFLFQNILGPFQNIPRLIKSLPVKANKTEL